MSQEELTGLLRDVHTLVNTNQGVLEELARFNRGRREWEQRNTEIQEANLRATQTLNVTMDEVRRQVLGSNVSRHAVAQHHRVSSVPPRLHSVTAEDDDAVEESDPDAQEAEEGSGDGDEEPMDVEPKD